MWNPSTEEKLVTHTHVIFRTEQGEPQSYKEDSDVDVFRLH